MLSGLAQRSDRTVRSHQALAELTGDSRTWNKPSRRGLSPGKRSGGNWQSLLMSVESSFLEQSKGVVKPCVPERQNSRGG